MKVRIAVVAVVATLVAGVTACSSSGGSSGGKSTVSEWVVPIGPNGEASVKSTLGPLAAKFKAETGITVNYTVIQWGDMLTKINAAVASGQGPDLTETGDTWSASLAATKAFEPWTDAAFNQIGGKSKFPPRTLTMTGLPGEPGMSIPLYASSFALYYNKALFAQAGITSPPATWDDFVADAKKLTNPGKGVWGASMDMTNLAAMETFDWLLATQFGGQYYDESNKPTVTDPKFVQAMTFFLNWIGSEKIMNPDAVSYSAAEAETAFAQGKAAMTIQQSPSQFKAGGMPDSAWGAAYVPMISANPPAAQKVMSHVDTINVAMFKSSKHKTAAYRWLKFLTDQQAQTALNSSYGYVPPTVAAAKDPAFGSQNDKVWIDIQSNYSAATPSQADAATLEEAVARAVGQLAQTAASKGKISESQVKSALQGVQAAALARQSSGS